MRSPKCRFPFLVGDRASGNSWLIHGTRRRWQPMQVESSDDGNMHLTFRRLHSQQECVPFRTFRRLTEVSSSDITVVGFPEKAVA